MHLCFFFLPVLSVIIKYILLYKIYAIMYSKLISMDGFEAAIRVCMARYE